MRFYGKVGYAIPEETGLDMIGDAYVERNYYGDVLKNNRRWENSGGVNDNLNISNRISIIADPFMYEHCYAIKYIEWMGSKWKVTDLEIERPRLIFTIGGVWNGSSPVESDP